MPINNQTTAEPQVLAKPHDSSQPRIRILAVLRDVALLYGTAFISTVALGMLGWGVTGSAGILLLAPIPLLIVAGFILSGCMAAGPHRRLHVALVALGFWLSGFCNMLLTSSGGEALLGEAVRDFGFVRVLSAVIVAALALPGLWISCRIKQ